jgi:signal transduction histidine kinase
MGIAHEIRNPLAGIRITAQAMDEEIDSGDSRKEYSGRIISEIDRLNDLLKSFFSYARPKNPDFSFCHIQEITQEVHLLIKKDLSDRDIDFVQDFGKGIPRLKVDFNQMKQVFLNLLLNSIHAMPLGGQLRVACTLNESRQKTDKRKRHAEITISDTGNGIDKQDILRIFDPFFTTKAKGLGLGLSITYRIIKKHGGNITVQSKKDEGTSFRITLPIDYEGDYFI